MTTMFTTESNTAMSASESNIYLAHLMAEMLSLSTLPPDLRQALADHLNKQLSLVNILKPEYCKRLYPILAELAELQVSTKVSGLAETNGTVSLDSITEISEIRENSDSY
ncbi:MAG: hypothetical protein J2P31_01190 [Blastocatellia bacterium]|nr:hypothetical protein [Blastocatellia bacterium]